MAAFYTLVIIGAVLLWFLLAFIFRPIGKIGLRIWKDAMDAMSDDDKETNKEKEQK